MTREILFRGKTKDGRWMYGDLVRRLVETTWQDILGEYQFAIAGTGEREKTVDFKNKRAEVISCTTVDPATVGQFTGLCDKDGKKIFEGDILYKEGHWTFYVGYEMGAFRAIPLEPVQKHNWSHCTLGAFLRVGMGDYKGFKVIGNIHDTPALVKEEAE